MDAEKGKPGTGMAVYTALLWTYGLLAPFQTSPTRLLTKKG